MNNAIRLAWKLLSNYNNKMKLFIGRNDVLFKKSAPTDVQLVHKASALLGVSEFQVFFDACQAWYNNTPSEKRIEVYFIDFLEQDAVPFWVRNYVRFILNRKDLLTQEKKRLILGVFTYYLPLLFFFILIMLAIFR